MTTQTAVQKNLNTNGVDVTALFETLDAIKGDPGLAEFRFRARNDWLDGGQNRSTIDGFYGCRAEDTTRSAPHVLDADEPPVLLGADQGANPVEYLLHALVSCLTTSMVYHAASRGIEIESLNSAASGDIDLRGFLGLSQEVRKGYREICVDFRVKSKASPATLRELAMFSPVYDVVSNSVPVKITVECV